MWDSKFSHLLKKTEWAQPALVLHGNVLSHLLKSHSSLFEKNRIVACLGHSLGEFTALACSGSLSLEETLTLVHQVFMMICIHPTLLQKLKLIS